MRRRPVLAFAGALALLVILMPAFVAFGLSVAVVARAASAPAFQIIVRANNPVTTVDRAFLQDAFLKKVTQWPDGTGIHPADLAANSPVRRRFSEDVLGRSVEAIKNYWQQRIFSGRDVPPPELDGDDEAVAYVAKHEGGLAYVSGTAKLDGVKAVTLR